MMMQIIHGCSLTQEGRKRSRETERKRQKRKRNTRKINIIFMCGWERRYVKTPVCTNHKINGG